MPPAHGALLAGRVLSSPALRSQWEAELAQICQRINGLRRDFCDALIAKTDRDFAFISEEHGMFSFLGLSVEQAQRLRNEKSVYVLDSSRINIAGLNAGNMDRVVNAVSAVL